MNYLEQLLFMFTKDNRRAHGLNGNKQRFGFYIIIYIIWYLCKYQNISLGVSS